MTSWFVNDNLSAAAAAATATATTTTTTTTTRGSNHKDKPFVDVALLRHAEQPTTSAYLVITKHV
jgi:hypothetical protein